MSQPLPKFVKGNGGTRFSTGVSTLVSCGGSVRRSVSADEVASHALSLGVLHAD